MELKEVIGFPNHAVSPCGRVFRVKWATKTREPKELLGKVTRHGYRKVGLKHGHSIFLHRLVATHYLPNPDNLPEVNHLDENKLNNHVSNLVWSTHADNMQHSAEKTNRSRKRGKKMTKQVKDFFYAISPAHSLSELSEIFDISLQWAYELKKRARK